MMRRCVKRGRLANGLTYCDSGANQRLLVLWAYSAPANGKRASRSTDYAEDLISSLSELVSSQALSWVVGPDWNALT
jgi:hypothetical protein